MKIAVVSTPVFPVPVPGYAGLEHLAWQQAKGLAAKGHEVYIVAPDGSTCEGATVIPCGPAGRVDEKMAFQTYWKELLKMDCVVDNSWQKWAYMIKAEGVLKCPVLGVLHALAHTMYQSLPPVENPCFVCISNDQSQHMEALHNCSTRLAYNGVDTDYYRSNGSPRTNNYLFLARFSTIKGPDLAIEAAKRAGVRLDLVGDTSITHEPELLAMIKSQCDGAQIAMVGPANRGECVWWFSQARCLLHPNQRFREPFGLAPVEAMACGTPVVAWKYGAMKETILHGITGYLASTMDEFVQFTEMIRDMPEDRLKEMRQHCRDRAGAFSVQKMVDRYDFLCHEAVDTGGW